MFLGAGQWGDAPGAVIAAVVWALALAGAGVALYSFRLGREEM